MYLSKFSKNLLVGIMVLITFIAGCSTQLEDRASIDFEPIIPTNAKRGRKTSMDQSTVIVSKAFLQQIEEHRKVGDILTVALSENFSASKVSICKEC